MDLIAALPFLRPWWLLLLPVAALLWWLQKSLDKRSPWDRVCDRAVLEELRHEPALKGDANARRWLFGAANLALIFALAGPVLPGSSSDLERRAAPLIIALDLSGSMLTQDGSNEPTKIPKRVASFAVGSHCVESVCGLRSI